MKEYVFDKNNYESYKDFYKDFYTQFKVSEYADFDGCENMNYNADILGEFLWYISDQNVVFRFKSFDVDKIKLSKSLEAYKWNIIFETIEDFVMKYPSNKLEFL